MKSDFRSFDLAWKKRFEEVSIEQNRICEDGEELCLSPVFSKIAMGGDFFKLRTSMAIFLWQFFYFNLMLGSELIVFKFRKSTQPFVSEVFE
jgi:hypothetical protein